MQKFEFLVEVKSSNAMIPEIIVHIKNPIIVVVSQNFLKNLPIKISPRYLINVSNHEISVLSNIYIYYKHEEKWSVNQVCD